MPRTGAVLTVRLLAVITLVVLCAALACLLALRAGLVSAPAWLPLPAVLTGAQPWAAGSCVTRAPAGPNRHATVFIDPGHGSPDPGTSGVASNGKIVHEKDVTLAIALLLAGRLQTDGYRVVLARTHDDSVARLTSADVVDGAFTVAGDHKDLLARVACANAAHAALLISLHFNAFSDPSVGGVETFYDDARPFSARNQAFAELVQRNVVAQIAAAGWQVPDRGAMADSTDDEPTLSAAAAAYNHLLELGPAQPGYLDHPSAMPGALLEALFLTDPIEATIAADPRGQDAIAHGVALAVEQFLPGS